MAIINKEGCYLKVEPDMCYANRHGFYVGYTIHSNLETRNLEKVREEKVRKLEEKVNSLYLAYVKELNAYARENNLILPDQKEKLPEDLLNKVNFCESIFNDMNRVRIGIYRGENLARPLNMELLISLGLDADWFETGMLKPTSSVGITSPYNRQRFDYETLYDELKKTLKDGFKDC